MSKTGKRLGRGLESLVSNLRGDFGLANGRPSLNEAPSAVSETVQTESPMAAPVFHVKQGADGSTPLTVPIEALVPNPYQPRGEMDEKNLEALAHSIRANGILQPIVVRRQHGRHEIIAGERRWTAAKRVGLKEVTILLREATDEQMLELALIENLQREDLNAIDRAKAYRQFCTRFQLSAEELAQRLGEDRSTVSNYMRLMDLPHSVQDLVSQGKLSMGHARCLLGTSDSRQREQWARKAVDEQLSVRQLEEIVRRQKDLPARPSHDQPNVRVPSPHIRDLQHRFEQALKTKVVIQEGRRKGSGRIVIDYFTLDDFDRIASLLGVPRD